MDERKNKKQKNQTNEVDVVSEAIEKSKFFDKYYSSLLEVQDKLSIDEIIVMRKALETATLQAQQREEERLKAELAEKERAKRLAEQKKRERIEQRKQQRIHKEHVDRVTCMDLPVDFENTYANEVISGIHVDSVADGLIASLDNLGKVDIEFISEITGETIQDVIKKLEGSIYQNPLTWGECFYKGFETSDEYLSGNILYKLNTAKEANEEYMGYFQRNVEALEKLIAPNIDTKDIYVTLGSPWVPADVIDEFILFLVGIDKGSESAKVYSEEQYKVLHDEFTGIWEIPEKSRFNRSINHGKYEELNCNVFGTDRMNMLNILENTLNQKTVVITDGIPTHTYDQNGKEIIKRMTNNNETVKAIERQEKLISEFRNWVWTDAERLKRLQRAYCIKFGNIRKRVFSGSFLDFPKMSRDISLYDYQKDAVARILFTPNTLLAHDVGAGKTYVMIAAGMELRRLGKSKKNLYVVPNNIVGQWKNCFMKMYPEANILVIDEKNFAPKKRTKALRTIQNEDFDAIIMAYSSFDMLSLSKRYYADLYKSQIAMLDKAREKFSLKGKIDIKEKRIKNALERLATEVPKNVCSIPFDELGINTLFLDEAHYYKNVPIESEIHRVHGINKSGSDKCKAMMDKVHCIQRQNNGGRIVFATGTPITNSLTDIFVVQKYLQEGELEFSGIHNFDNWVGMFAEKTTEYEIDVDTNSYHLKTRFARFKNIPELTAILSSVADFHHGEEREALPDFTGYTDSVAEGSMTFKDYLRDISSRADDVRNKRVSRKQDNMLKITSDGRKAALDIRLIDRIFGREADSKVMRCAENIADIYFETRDTNSVQLVFCDISTPKDGFNLYDELRQLLIAMGIPASKIAFIHDAENDKEKEDLFRDLRLGDKSVIIGSTAKTGHGVNIQERLVALHHLDVPWRPADMVQREGRIIRRGNTSKNIKIFRYITKGSFDAYSWQLLEAKQRFISQILAGQCGERECSDVDETVLNYAEVKALAVGNPKIKKRVEVANELNKYRILERDMKAKRAKQREELDGIPSKIEAQKHRIELCELDIVETDILIASENEAKAKEEAAISARKAAIDAKNVARDAAEHAEREWKKADRLAKKLEKAAKKDQGLISEAEKAKEKANALYAEYIPLSEQLLSARESVEDARDLVAENTKDGEEARALRQRIYNMVKVNIDNPEEKYITDYRGFKLVVPPYMRPRKVKERNSEGILVESEKTKPYICLIKNGRYYVDIGEEFGILRVLDNFINNLREQKRNYENGLENYKVRIDVLSSELARKNDYIDEITALQSELDELDEELGLKGA